MGSLVGQLALTPKNGYKIWEDPSFIKWRKRDAHVPMHCHESIEGRLCYLSFSYYYDVTFGLESVYDLRRGILFYNNH